MRDARIYFALRVFVSKQPHKNASSGFRLRGPSLRDEPEIVRSALKHRGFDLQFASPRLRNDRQMVRTAVKQDYRALEFASSEMRDDDPGIVYTAVRKNSAALKFASMAVLDNTDFAFAVIEKYPDALYELSSQLHNYRKVVLDAVKREGLVLQYASDELRDDWGVAFAAIRSYPDAIRYIGPTLPQRSQMGACGYQERSVVVSGNKPRVAQRSLVRPSFRYASPQLRADRDIVLSVIGSCSHILEEVGVQLRDDRESVSLLAIEQDSSALELAIAELQNEFAIVRAAVRKRRVVVAVCQCRLAERRNDCPGRGQIKCISGPRSCQFCYARLCEPIARSFSLPSANTTRRVTVKASPELQDDPQIVVAAIKTYPRATQGAGVHAKGTPARLFSL